MDLIEQLCENKENIIKDYKFIECIGKGAFGYVYKVLYLQTGIHFAIKILCQKKGRQSTLEKMESNHNNTQISKNQNIVRYHEIFFYKSHSFLVMEWLQGGTLSQYLSKRIQEGKPLTEAEICIIIKGITNGLYSLHSHGFIHRDLKLENIMLAKQNYLNSIKIIDLGLSIGFSSNYGSFRNQCGTPIYLAPECLQKQFYSKVDIPIDIWSLGIIMYQLSSNGSHPFFEQDYDKQDLYNAIQHKELQIPSVLSHLGGSLLKNLLQINPSDRYTIEQVIQHPLITGNQLQIVPLTVQETFTVVKQEFSLIQKIIACMIISRCKSFEQPLIFEEEEEEISEDNRSDELEKIELNAKKDDFQEKHQIISQTPQPWRFY